MNKYELIIKGRLDGLNEYIDACRTNKYRGAVVKRSNQNIVEWQIKTQLKGVCIDGPVKIDFCWIEPNARRDIDNICFAKKFILDALVESNVIQGDGQKIVKGFTDTFGVDKENPRIEIKIEEVEKC